MISIFINVIVPVIIIFFTGYIVGRIFNLDQKSFSTISIYILTPCLVLTSLTESNNIFTITTLKILVSVTILIIITYIAIEIYSRIFKIPQSLKTILLLTLILPNTGNYGIPVTEYAYGKEALPVASILLVIYIFFTHTLGVFIASREKGDYKEALTNVLKIPVIYSFIVALVISYFKIKIPNPILLPIKSIGYSAIPLNLLLVGINLSRVKIDRNLILVSIVSLIKLFLIPLVASVIMRILRIEGLDFKVSLLQIAMPSAIYCSILATHFEGDEKLASEIVLASIILSITSLSMIIYIMG